MRRSLQIGVLALGLGLAACAPTTSLFVGDCAAAVADPTNECSA